MVISKIKQTNLDKKMFTNIGTRRVEVYKVSLQLSKSVNTIEG